MGYDFDKIDQEWINSLENDGMGSCNMGLAFQNNHIDISDKTIDNGLTRSIDYREVTDETIGSIISDGNIKYIQVSKELPDKAYQIIDRILGDRADMTFRIWGLFGIKHYDISYLHKMANLRHLFISCSLGSSPDLIDFGLIKGLPLKSFCLDAFDLRDYSFIKDLPKDLEKLSVMADSNSKSVRFDCKWLLKYKDLTELFLGGKASKNITCIQEMKSLTGLSVYGITLDDFSFMKDIGLKKLALSGNKNSDLSGLGELTTLKEIYLRDIYRLSDTGFLENLTSLEKITLENLNLVMDLPDLSRHSALKEINLDNTGIRPGQIDEKIRPIVHFPEARTIRKSSKKENKKKNIYTARIAVDDELLANLSPERIGCLESWYLMSQGASYTIFLFVPDLKSTDTFSFDVLFDDKFREKNDVKTGDHFPVSIPSPTILRQLEITGISEGEPINTMENKRPVKHSLSETANFLEWYLYHYINTDECLGEDGWFNAEELIRQFAERGFLLDLPDLELIANKDGDHRYIFNEDKSKLRISPEHPAPKKVEELMRTADSLKVKRSVFIENDLPYKKDRKRKIHVECSDGCCFDFPYQTNKIFYMDSKHFFMLTENHGDLMLAVSSYMTKDGRYQYRTCYRGFPDVLNHLFMDSADLLDYEGKTYRVTFMVTDK